MLELIVEWLAVESKKNNEGIILPLGYENGTVEKPDGRCYFVLTNVRSIGDGRDRRIRVYFSKFSDLPKNVLAGFIDSNGHENTGMFCNSNIRTGEKGLVPGGIPSLDNRPSIKKSNPKQVQIPSSKPANSSNGHHSQIPTNPIITPQKPPKAQKAKVKTKEENPKSKKPSQTLHSKKPKSIKKIIKNDPEISRTVSNKPLLPTWADSEELISDLINVGGGLSSSVLSAISVIGEIRDGIGYSVNEFVSDGIAFAKKTFEVIGKTVEVTTKLTLAMYNALEDGFESFSQYLCDLERLASGAITLAVFAVKFGVTFPFIAVDKFYTHFHEKVVSGLGGDLLKIGYTPVFIVANGYYKLVPPKLRAHVSKGKGVALNLGIFAGKTGLILAIITSIFPFLYFNPGNSAKQVMIEASLTSIEATTKLTNKALEDLGVDTGEVSNQVVDNVQKAGEAAMSLLKYLIYTGSIGGVLILVIAILTASKNEPKNDIDLIPNPKSKLEVKIDNLARLFSTKAMVNNFDLILNESDEEKKKQEFREVYLYLLSNKNHQLYDNITNSDIMSGFQLDSKLNILFDRFRKEINDAFPDGINKIYKDRLTKLKKLDVMIEGEIKQLTKDLIKYCKKYLNSENNLVELEE